MSTPLPEIGPEPPRLVPATVAEQLDAGLRRLSSLVRGIPDLEVPAVGTWSAADVACHIATGAEVYGQILRGEGSPYTDLERIGALSQSMIDAVADRTPFALADRIDAGREALVAAATEGGAAADPLVPYHAGITVPRSVAAALVVAEVCVHGHDIARAARRMWHIEPAEAATAFRSYLPIVGHFLAPAAAGHTARYDVRVRRFPAARAVFAFDDGNLVVEGNPQGPVDCKLSATGPALLMVLMGRTSPVRAAVRGDVLAFGRKPWLGLGLPGLFGAP